MLNKIESLVYDGQSKMASLSFDKDGKSLQIGLIPEAKKYRAAMLLIIKNLDGKYGPVNSVVESGEKILVNNADFYFYKEFTQKLFEHLHLMTREEPQKP